jgi:hypothetical protein
MIAAEPSKKTVKKLNARSIGVCPRLVNPLQDIEQYKKAQKAEALCAFNGILTNDCELLSGCPGNGGCGACIVAQ